MGRTVPTFTHVIQVEMETWSKFRRGLRKDDQDALDELFRAARLQLASSAYAARPIPFESIVMSMLIMQQRMIKKLQQHLTAGRMVSSPACPDVVGASYNVADESGRQDAGEETMMMESDVERDRLTCEVVDIAPRIPPQL